MIGPGQYEFLRQERIVFGRPASEAVLDTADELGARRLFIVASKTLSRKTDVVPTLRAAMGERCVGLFDESEEHTPRDSVMRAAEAVRNAEPDLIVTMGGGSPIDTVKVLQIVLAEGIRSTDELGEYRIQVQPGGGRHVPSVKPSPVRQIIIPTTLSAAEFSNIGGCTDRRRKVKDLYTAKDICGQVVILDPAVTVHTPDWLWLSTGIRAVDHAVESVCSRTGHPFVEATSLEGLRMLRQSLPANKRTPGDLAMRLQSQLGVWLASTGIGRVEWGASHGIGHQLGAVAGVPHGYTSCVMLPNVMQYNADHVEDRARKIADAFGAPGRDAAAGVRTLVGELGLPVRLEDVGVTRDHFDDIANGAMQNPMVLSNPRPITEPGQVKEILELAM